MNNNIIKSLRRTLLCTVSAAAVAIGFTACADETFTPQNTTVPANGYQVIIPSNMGGGDTRAIAYNSETGGYDETFELTDRIYVYNNKLEGWSDGPLKPDAEGKSTNLVGTLNFYSEDIAVGDELLLCYKGTSFYYSRDFSSDTSLSDYSLATVKITDIKDGFIKTSAATFKNLQSVYKFNFTGIASGVKIKNVFIESEQRKLVNSYSPTNKEWPNNFGPVTYTFKEEGADLNELIFLLRFADNPDNKNESGTPSTSGDVISFRALGSDGHYYVGTKSVTADLENSKYYQTDVKMEDGGMAMKVTNITAEETLAPSTYYQVYTDNANYLAEYKGYGSCIEWYGGNDANHTLTIKDLTMNNSRDGAIAVKTSEYDPDNTKVHKLVLEGENTLSVAGEHTSLTVQNNCSLIISGTGKLTLKAPKNAALGLWNNANVTIESGEVTIDGSLGGENNSCVIGVNGKLRILTEKIYPNTTDCIKAVDGYVLIANKDGDYTVFTVIEDDGSGLAKSIWVTPTITLGYYSDSNGHIRTAGNSLYYVILPENTKNKSVTCTTSNPNAVEIEEVGVSWVSLRPNGLGVATVTVTTNDDTNLSSECIVTVKPLGGIWYENYEVNVTPGSQPFINPLKIVGKGVTSVTYTSSDESIATVNASTGEVTIAAGATAGQTVYIYARATLTEDGEYYYPEWCGFDSYHVNIVAPTGQGQREDYGPGEW